MMVFPPWFMQAVLVVWLVVVGLAYITGASPVFGLIGVIMATISILLRSWSKKAS